MSVPYRRSVAAGGAVLTAAACAAAIASSGNAQGSSTTYTITNGEQRIAQLDVAPKGLPKGRFSLGDKVFATGPVTRDGHVRGVEQLELTVGNRRPVKVGRVRGFVTGVYHFADGDLYLESHATLDDEDTDTGVIVGGTGAYAGARGTVVSTASKDVVRLLP